MSTLVAVTFAGEADARAALGSIRALEKDGQVGIEDTAVVTKDADGKVQVKNEASSGAVIGGLVGRAAAPGVDGNFVKEVEASLPAGGSALFLLVKSGQPGLLIASMRQYEGTVVQTSLDEEEEAALREALK